MEKIRYETDPFNRLVISNKRSGLSRSRRVVDGVFKIGSDNSLTYHAKSPIEEGATAPYQLKFSGTWAITKNHDLEFVLNAENNAADSGLLTLAGQILEAKGGALLFVMTTKTVEGSRRTYILELSGSWHIDDNNRLAFSVKRLAGDADTLTLDAAWNIGNSNELVYTYEKSRSRRRTRTAHRISFKGRWEINHVMSLSYLLESGSNSALNFRTAMGMCNDKGMTFQIGVGVTHYLKPVIRTVVLYGTWKFSRASGVSFETECADGRVYSLSFGAEARLTPSDRVILRLRDPAGKKDLGLEVALSHDMLGSDGSAFLRLLRSKDESAVLIGGACRW